MLVERFLEENRLVYGVTTGFGDNSTRVIRPEEAEALQRNIVRSHAVSVGDPLPREVVRATQLMILISLGKGYSGVTLDLLQHIAALLNTASRHLHRVTVRSATSDPKRTWLSF